MADIEEKIKKTEEKLKQLKEEKRKIERAEKSRLSKRQRAEDTRKKILLGSYIMTIMEANEETKKKFVEGLGKFLTRPDDRALFDLPSPPPLSLQEPDRGPSQRGEAAPSREESP